MNPRSTSAASSSAINDIEVDPTDNNFDNGRNLRTRFRNNVVGAKVGIHPAPTVDVRRRGLLLDSNDADADAARRRSFGLTGCGYSPVIAGQHNDWSRES